MPIPGNDSNTYTAADIQRYLSRQMPAAEMHALEKAALDDPFLADAIEGYAMYQKGEDATAADLQELRNLLAARSAQAGSMVPAGNFRWWRVAAAIVLLAGMGTITYTLFHFFPQGKRTMARNETVVITPAVPDSLTGNAALSVDSASLAGNNPATVPPSVRAPRMKQAMPSGAPIEKEPSGITIMQAAPQADTITGRQQDEYAAGRATMKDQEKPAAAFKREMGERMAPPVNRFSGKITDKMNHPVSNASVLVLNTQLQVETDSGGYFNFTLPDSIAYVALTVPGFDNATAALHAAANNQIQLKDSRQVSNETVVTGYPLTTKKTTSGNAKQAAVNEPVTGWAAFYRYIAQNKRMLPGEQAHGEVVLSFTINDGGRPGNITVEKPVGKLPDQEAVRLLKDGPAWKATKDNTGKATVSIRL